MSFNRSSLFAAGLLVLACGLLGACQPQAGRATLAPDEKLQITSAVWANYEEYLRIKGSAAGAFAVTESGTGSAYTYCPETKCRAGSYTGKVIEMCESAGVKCVIFAQGSSILVDYEIVD